MMSFATLNSIVIYLWIALGSGVGGVLRYVLTLWMIRTAGPAFPWGTLLVNILGCTFMGWFATMTGADGRLLVSTRTRQFVMIGICGGFTTFSSFSLETLNLLREGEAGRALAYVALSVGICLLGVWGGHWLATAMQR
jgi:CrcB protein